MNKTVGAHLDTTITERGRLAPARQSYVGRNRGQAVPAPVPRKRFATIA